MFWVLHSFVNIFAGGRSDSKPLLFLLYVFLLLIFVYFTKKTTKKVSILYGVISLSLLYLYGLVSHIFLSKYYGVSLRSFVITGNNTEISSTTLYHIHEAKGVVGFLLSKIGVSQLQTIDAGGAYLHILSSWWFSVGVLLLMGTIVFTVLAIRNFSKSYSTGNKIKNALFILFYGIVSFSLVKTAIDGGVLSPHLLAIGAGIYIFNFMQKQKDNRPVLLGVFTASIVGLVAILVRPDWSGGIVLMQSVATLLLLTSLSIILFGAPKRIYILSTVLLFLISWWMASARDRSIFTYGQTSVELGSSYIFYNKENHLVQRVISDQNTKIKDIVRSQHKNLSYAPVSVPGKTCSEGGLPNFADVLIKTDKSMENIETPFVYIKNKGQSFEGSWWQTKVTIMMSPCLPEPLTVINDTLLEHGFDFYVMVNPVFYDESVIQ